MRAVRARTGGLVACRNTFDDGALVGSCAKFTSIELTNVTRGEVNISIAGVAGATEVIVLLTETRGATSRDA